MVGDRRLALAKRVLEIAAADFALGGYERQEPETYRISKSGEDGGEFRGIPRRYRPIRERGAAETFTRALRGPAGPYLHEASY